MREATSVKSSLGRDFWLFRVGQLISLVGDACGDVALAWWILDKTGSAGQMAAILAPAMFVRTALLPLIGPIGDMFPRKWLLALSDAWRGILLLGVTYLVISDTFNLSLVMALYIVLGLGTALFESSGGIVPQLVPADRIPEAIQKSETLRAAASVAGGLIGGLAVSVIGIKGAFAFDALSFAVAAACSIAIRANTSPAKSGSSSSTGSFGDGIRRWRLDLVSGFRFVLQVRVLLGIGFVAMLLNLVLAPLNVILPVLVKQGRDLPAWFLGSLESSAGAGSILGAFIAGWVCRKILADRAVVLGIILIGCGVALLPFAPTAVLPGVLMFWIGIGGTIANVPIQTQVSLTVPNHYRARVGSLIGFLCHIAAPAGTALSGLLIETLGLNGALLAMGGTTIVLTPLLLVVPGMSEFLRVAPEKAGDYFAGKVERAEAS